MILIVKQAIWIRFP